MLHKARISVDSCGDVDGMIVEKKGRLWRLQQWNVFLMCLFLLLKRSIPAGTRLTFNVESTLIFNHTSTKPEFNQISTIYQFLVDLQRWFNVESTLMFNYNFQEKKVDLQRWFNVESTLRINQNFQEKLGWSSALIQRWINVDDQP